MTTFSAGAYELVKSAITDLYGKDPSVKADIRSNVDNKANMIDLVIEIQEKDSGNKNSV